MLAWLYLGKGEGAGLASKLRGGGLSTTFLHCIYSDKYRYHAILCATYYLS